MEFFNMSHLPDTYNISNIYAKLIGDRDREIYQLVNYYIITSIISLLGIVANVINAVVFYKQGFATTMNISFFALAISDMCSLVFMVSYSVVLSGLLVKAGVRMYPAEVAYITVGHPRICFSRITSWITVFITAERCMCIIFPMKIKQIITPRRTALIICAIFILIILSFEPEYETAYLGWKFDDSKNYTIIGLMFTSDRKKSEGLVFIIYSILGFVTFVTIIIFTLLLVIQLRKQSKWRLTASNDKTRSEPISSRERKAMTMVVMIATVLIVCYTPGVALSSVTFIEPEFTVRGRYINALFALWSIVAIFETLNSSVNIFMYYHMSTKYRETLHMLFCVPNNPNSIAMNKHI